MVSCPTVTAGLVHTHSDAHITRLCRHFLDFPLGPPAQLGTGPTALIEWSAV